MGAGVSDWRLARAVARAGQLGVVSGTALDVILARRLQTGDAEGAMRSGLAHFPMPGVADRILARYFVRGGKRADEPFKSKPLLSAALSRDTIELIVASNFVEVWLARQSHDRPIGINYLEKIQPPTLASIYGAMLAGVSCVLMGAGIPRAIPGVLDQLARGEAAELLLDVQGASVDSPVKMRFDPAEFWPGGPREMHRPEFYAIVSSATLANVLAKKASGRVDGFVVEGPSAGGHNAPPRGAMKLNERGEPIYGERDAADLDAIAALGLPFWLAGQYATAEKLCEALARGASGVQVGTAFAFCDESGLDASIKRLVLEQSAAGQLRIHTDPLASPTGYPFKVLPLQQTRADPAAAPRVGRMCDLGYLRQAYMKENGTIGWRCPAEPVEDYVRKGGRVEETVGRQCVCNGLLANIGLGQVRSDASMPRELPLVTAGDDVASVARFLKPGEASYSAATVIESLLTPCAVG